jgi:uncharacterized protein YozE (UPF0346 family)
MKVWEDWLFPKSLDFSYVSAYLIFENISHKLL